MTAARAAPDRSAGSGRRRAEGAPAPAAPGATGRRAARAALVALYLGFVASGLLWPHQPRAFWTVTLPLLVLGIVLGGFHLWRTLCPLAALGALGGTLARRAGGASERRAPAWLERNHLRAPFLLLAALLWLRLVATNGDGRWLAGLLVALALAAIAVNFAWSGKSWCNFLCPVGFVERVYTDPSALRAGGNSQCARCTACKRSCPDIDQEASYWRELLSPGRRAATFAFPGLVLGFYAYFYLRAGDWEAYFDGRWTRQGADRWLLLGPGFFFAPELPAAFAAAATLAVFAFASSALFRAVEAFAARFLAAAERRRHLVLSLAAFAAFNLFYLFAGAPTLRKLPYGTRAMAFAAPAVATLVLARRWRRSHERYVREKGAAKLVRNWPFEEPPPADPAEAFALVRATERAREQVLAGYLATVREVVAEGVVREGERRLFEELRRQFGITEREHEKVLAQLAREERELVAGARAGAESRLQLEGYASALTEALLRRASAEEIDELRRSFGISEETHGRQLEAARAPGGPLAQCARRKLDELAGLAADRRALEREPRSSGATSEAAAAVDFLAALLRRAEERALGQLLDLLASLGEAERVAAVRAALRAAERGDRAARAHALGQLERAGPAAGAIAERLRALLAEQGGPAPPPADLAARSARHLAAEDPFLRAGALWYLAAAAPGEATARLLAAAARDRDPRVAATASAIAGGRGAGAREPRFEERALVERMQLLRRVPLFERLEPDDLEELSGMAREETLDAGALLCEEGASDEGDLFVLLAGRAAVVLRRAAAEGAAGVAEQEVAELGEHELVGELALLDGRPRSATVRAKGGPLRVLRIPGRDFRARLLRREEVARPLLLTLTERLRRLAGRLAAAEQ